MFNLAQALTTAKTNAERLARQAGAEFVIPVTTPGLSMPAQVKAKGNDVLGSTLAASRLAGVVLGGMGGPALQVARNNANNFAGNMAALTDMGADYINAKFGTNLPHAPAPVKELSTRARQGYEKGNEALHTDDPKNAVEVGVRALASMAMPMKVGALPIKNVPLQKTAQALTEVALPGRQGGMASALVGAGIGGAIQDGIDMAAETNGGPGVEGYRSFKNAVVDDQKLQDIPDPTPHQYLTEQERAAYAEAVEYGDEDSIADLELEDGRRAEEAKTQRYELPKPKWQDDAAQGAIFGLAATAAIFGTRWRGAVNNSVHVNPQSLMGEVRDKTTLGTVDRVIGGVVQSDQPLRTINKKVASSAAHLDQLNAKLDRVSAPSFNARIHYGIDTGEFEHGIQVEAPRRVWQDYAGFSPDERTVIAEGILAKRAYGEYQRNGLAVEFRELGEDASGVFDIRKYKQELQSRIQSLDNNTKLSPFATRVQKQYDGMLWMNVHGGISNNKHAIDLKLKRPNYVPIRKNIVDNLGDQFKDTNGGQKPFATQLGLMKTATTEGGGVKLGEAADPVHILFDEWTKRLHGVDMNSTRREVLDLADQSGLYNDIIKKVPPGNNSPDVVKVWRDGVEESWHIKDPLIRQAFDLNPFAARNGLIAAANVHRKMHQWALTGLGSLTSGGFMLKATTMDSIWGAVLRPKGSQAGMINELINKVGKNQPGNAFIDATKNVLSYVDPTGGDNAIGMLARIPIGTVRGIADDVVESVAKYVDDAYASDSTLKKFLGPQQLDALRIRTREAHLGTTKSLMKQTGASGASMFGGDRPQSIGQGAKTLAPDGAAALAADNAKNAHLNNAPGLEQALLNAKSVGMQIHANGFARLLSSIGRSLQENIHESSRYAFFAANEGKFASRGGLFKRAYINDADAAELIASQTRRLAGDVGQTGAHKLTQDLNSAIKYANVGVQSPAQFGRMLVKQPGTTIFNTVNVMGQIGAAYMLGLYLDPDLRRRVANMTPEQRAATVPMPVGLDFTMPQELRYPTAFMLAAFDEITGMNEVGDDGMPNFNMDFAEGFMEFLDEGLSEENQFELEEMKKAALGAMNPVNPMNVPAVEGTFAAFGMDPQRTSLDGTGAPIKTQQVSGLDTDKELVGDKMSAQSQKVWSAVVTSAVAGFIRPAMDALRALDKDVPEDVAQKVALSRVEDMVLRNPGNVAGKLWGQDYERADPKDTLSNQVYRAKAEGIKSILKVKGDFEHPYSTTKSAGTAHENMFDVMPANLQGTQAGAIYSHTKLMEGNLRQLVGQVGQLTEQMEQIDNQYTSTIQERNAEKNEKLAEREELQRRITDLYKYHEGLIRKEIGDPTFTFQGVDIDEYAKKPLSVVVPGP